MVCGETLSTIPACTKQRSKYYLTVANPHVSYLFQSSQRSNFLLSLQRSSSPRLFIDTSLDSGKWQNKQRFYLGSTSDYNVNKNTTDLWPCCCRAVELGAASLHNRTTERCWSSDGHSNWTLVLESRAPPHPHFCSKHPGHKGQLSKLGLGIDACFYRVLWESS